MAGDYVLEISLSSFSNPEERDAVGDCCFDNGTAPLQGVCPGSCNTTLWVCVQDSDVPPNDFTCTIGMGIIPETLSSVSIFSQGAWPVRMTTVHVATCLFKCTIYSTQLNTVICRYILCFCIFMLKSTVNQNY